MSKLEHKETWTGEHRGIRYEICKWGLSHGRGPTWDYYLFIHMNQVPEGKKQIFSLEPDKNNRLSFTTYPYSSASVISDLDWHGGITFYDKLGGIDGKPLIIQMGCDYAHLYDEGVSYNEERIQREAIASIDKLRELCPELMLRCSWNGKFYPESSGTMESGRFVSEEGRADRIQYREKKEVTL